MKKSGLVTSLSANVISAQTAYCICTQWEREKSVREHSCGLLEISNEFEKATADVVDF